MPFSATRATRDPDCYPSSVEPPLRRSTVSYTQIGARGIRPLHHGRSAELQWPANVVGRGGFRRARVRSGPKFFSLEQLPLPKYPFYHGFILDREADATPFLAQSNNEDLRASWSLQVHREPGA